MMTECAVVAEESIFGLGLGAYSSVVWKGFSGYGNMFFWRPYPYGKPFPVRVVANGLQWELTPHDPPGATYYAPAKQQWLPGVIDIY